MIVEIRDEVVSLSGVLNRNHWHTLESAVKVRLKYHPTGIVVDCGGLDALTPEGAETFRDAARHIAASGQDARFVLANVPAEVMRVLRQIPNLGSQIPLAATVADARLSLGLSGATAAAAAASSSAAADSAANAGTQESGGIVVGLFGDEGDRHAVAVGCRLAGAEAGNPAAARVYLTFLLRVPRNVPLLSPMAAEEEAARETLERFETAVREERRLPVPRVERTRDPAARLVEVAETLRARSIVLALLPDALEERTQITETVLFKASCDVIINRLPAPTVEKANERGVSQQP